MQSFNCLENAILDNIIIKLSTNKVAQEVLWTPCIYLRLCIGVSFMLLSFSAVLQEQIFFTVKYVRGQKDKAINIQRPHNHIFINSNAFSLPFFFPLLLFKVRIEFGGIMVGKDWHKWDALLIMSYNYNEYTLSSTSAHFKHCARLIKHSQQPCAVGISISENQAYKG